VWLDKQRVLIEGNKPQHKPKGTYDEDMVTKVKSFQSSAGLEPGRVRGYIYSITPDYENRQRRTYA
jgi:hypothetical protein